MDILDMCKHSLFRHAHSLGTSSVSLHNPHPHLPCNHSPTTHYNSSTLTVCMRNSSTLPARMRTSPSSYMAPCQLHFLVYHQPLYNDNLPTRPRTSSSLSSYSYHLLFIQFLHVCTLSFYIYCLLYIILQFYPTYKYVIKINFIICLIIKFNRPFLHSIFVYIQSPL